MNTPLTIASESSRIPQTLRTAMRMLVGGGVLSAVLVGMGAWGFHAQWNDAFGPVQGPRLSSLTATPHWIARPPFTESSHRALPPLARDGRFDVVCSNTPQRVEQGAASCEHPQLLHAPSSPSAAGPNESPATPLPAPSVVAASVDFGSQRAARQWIAGDAQERAMIQHQVAMLPLAQQTVAKQALDRMDTEFHGCPTRHRCGWIAEWSRGAGKVAEAVCIAVLYLVH